MTDQIRSGLRIELKVHPSKPKTAIRYLDLKQGIGEVDIAAPATDNKANRELLKFLKKTFKREVRIISGASCKKKIIEFS